MKNFILLIAALIVLIAACDDTSNNPGSDKVIFPLKAGNTWIYKITSYDSLGNITKTVMDTLIALKDTTVAGEKIFLIMEKQPSLKKPAIFGAVNRSDGFHYLFFDDDSANKVIDWFFYKYPASVGDVFTRNEETATVQLTDTLIGHLTVGSFHCLKYNKVAYYGENMNQNVMYAAPDVGTVYSEFYYAYKTQKKYLDSKHELVKLILN